jgi:alpha-tubulin suppressor-like RCC1 family protein
MNFNDVCGLRADGVLQCGSPPAYYPSPIDVPGTLFRKAAVGSQFGCGVENSGRLECWGSSDGGVLDPPVGTFRDVAVGPSHACAIREDASVVCWGANSNGESTAPTVRLHTISVNLGFSCGISLEGVSVCWGGSLAFDGLNGRRVRSISAGRAFGTCAVLDDGHVECVGQPNLRHVPSGEFRQVAVGEYHACAVRADARIVCWGMNTLGQATPPTE